VINIINQTTVSSVHSIVEVYRARRLTIHLRVVYELVQRKAVVRGPP